jgi:glycosyltransferase involved in cell wall biosynthesis
LIRIIHLSNVAGRLGGGVSEVVHGLLPNQRNLGYMSSLWFLGSKSQENEIANDNKIDIGDLKAIKFNLFSLISNFFSLKRINNKNLIIHQHGIFLPTSLLSLSVNKTAKIIINPHGYLEPEKLQVSSFKKNLVLRLFERKNLNNCHCLIACSEKEAISLRKFGLKQPIAILPNGVSDSMIKLNTSNTTTAVMHFKEKYGVAANQKILLFLSRIHPFKGLKLFLKTVLKIQDQFRKNNWVFLIAGMSELGHEKDLKLFVEENNISDIVKFIGPQFDQDKIDAYDSSDCFILPSKGENFGIAVIEALSRGLPVIATESTPWENLETENCGWWIGRNEEDFIKTIIDLFSKDKEYLELMGKNGIELVKNKYTWSQVAKQSLEIYEWVLGNFNKDNQNGFDLLSDSD